MTDREIAWKTAVLEGCRALLPGDYLNGLRLRVAAAFDRIVASRPGLVAVDAKQILRCFRDRGLVTDALIECCEELRHAQLPPTEGLAVAFAACWHPVLPLPPSERSLLAARVSTFIQAAEKERIASIIQRFFPGPAPFLMARQVARVLLWLTPESDREAIRDRTSVQAVFRRKGLIPPALVQHFVAKKLDASTDPELLAICFAACSFPERAFQMDPVTELPGRVASFLDALTFLRGFEAENSAPLEVAHELLARSGAMPEGFPESSLTPLLSDLSAAESVAEGWPGEVAAVERVAGAALFLATSRAERIQIVMKNWLEERGFLSALRSQICTTPLAFARDSTSTSRRPEWPDVKRAAAKVLEEVPEQHLDSAIVLTQMAWNKVADLRVAMPVDSVHDFWNDQMAKLLSGFPYFAFLSRFTYWWKQCLRTHSFRRLDEEPHDDQDGSYDALVEPPGEELSPALLRSFQEGYRLVRTTFFRRADSRTSPSAGEGDVVENNEAVRRALDAIWYERLSRLDEEDEGVEMVKAIAGRFPDLGLDMITNLTHRLPVRMQAYTLARSRRMSNTEIEGVKKVTPGVAGRTKEEYPFQRETGFLPVTSLARGLPLERSLLWAFAGFVFLHPKVVPQRPDPWTLARFVRELWYWLRDVPLAGSAEILPWDELGPEARAAVDAFRQDPQVNDLLRDLMTCSTADELARWQPKSGLAILETLAQRIRSLLPVETVSRLFSTQGVAQLRRASLQSNHWIVPVWYYSYVEGEAAAALPFRLAAESSAVPKIEAIHQRMLALDRPQTNPEV